MYKMYCNSLKIDQSVSNMFNFKKRLKELFISLQNKIGSIFINIYIIYIQILYVNTMYADGSSLRKMSRKVAIGGANLMLPLYRCTHFSN